MGEEKLYFRYLSLCKTSEKPLLGEMSQLKFTGYMFTLYRIAFRADAKNYPVLLHIVIAICLLSG